MIFFETLCIEYENTCAVPIPASESPNGPLANSSTTVILVRRGAEDCIDLIDLLPCNMQLSPYSPIYLARKPTGNSINLSIDTFGHISVQEMQACGIPPENRRLVYRPHLKISGR